MGGNVWRVALTNQHLVLFSLSQNFFTDSDKRHKQVTQQILFFLNVVQPVSNVGHRFFPCIPQARHGPPGHVTLFVSIGQKRISQVSGVFGPEQLAKMPQSSLASLPTLQTQTMVTHVCNRTWVIFWYILCIGFCFINVNVAPAGDANLISTPFQCSPPSHCCHVTGHVHEATFQSPGPSFVSTGPHRAHHVAQQQLASNHALNFVNQIFMPHPDLWTFIFIL